MEAKCSRSTTGIAEARPGLIPISCSLFPSPCSLQPCSEVPSFPAFSSACQRGSTVLVDEGFDVWNLKTGAPDQAPVEKLRSQFTVAYRQVRAAGYARAAHEGRTLRPVCIGGHHGRHAAGLRCPWRATMAQRRYRVGMVFEVGDSSRMSWGELAGEQQAGRKHDPTRLCSRALMAPAGPRRQDRPQAYGRTLILMLRNQTLSPWSCRSMWPSAFLERVRQLLSTTNLPMKAGGDSGRLLQPALHEATLFRHSFGCTPAKWACRRTQFPEPRM